MPAAVRRIEAIQFSHVHGQDGIKSGEMDIYQEISLIEAPTELRNIDGRDTALINI